MLKTSLKLLTIEIVNVDVVLKITNLNTLNIKMGN